MLFFPPMRHDLNLPPLSRMGASDADMTRRIPAPGRDAAAEPAQPMNGRTAPGREA